MNKETLRKMSITKLTRMKQKGTLTPARKRKLSPRMRKRLR